MSYNLGSASGRIDLTYTGSSAVRRAQSDIAGLRGMLEAAGVSMGTLGKAAALGVGGALVAGLAVATKSAADFEKQLSGIAAVSGANAQQMDMMRDKALQLGKDTQFSASEAASAMEELVKAGLSVDEVLGGAADAAVSLAAAGGIGIPEAATLASNAMNQFNLTAAELPAVVDQMAGAANASAIDVGDLGMSLKQVGAVANLAGMSFEDTATAIALMGNAGIKGSDAGTSLKTMLQNLNPVTDRQIDLFRELGVITEDGSNRFFDAQGNVKSFSEVSGVLQEALKGQTRQQKLATLETMFGADAIRAAAIAANAGADGVNKMQEEMSKMTAAEVAAKRMDNLSGSFEQLKGSVETAMIIGGSGLLVVLRSIVDGLTQGVNSATEFAEAIGSKMSPGFNDLISTVGNVINIIQEMIGAFDGAGGSLAGLGIDAAIGLFNTLASVLNAVTGALEGHGEVVLVAAGAWLIMSKGGLAAVITQLGYLAAYALVRALDGLMALQGAATATGARMTVLAAQAKAAAAALGAVAVVVGVVGTWNAYRKSVEDVEDALASASKAMRSGSIPDMLDQANSLKKMKDEYSDLNERVIGKGTSAWGQFGNAAWFATKQIATLDFSELGKAWNASDALDQTSQALQDVKDKIAETGHATLALAHDLGDIDDKKLVGLLEGLDKMDPTALNEIQAMLEGYRSQLSLVGISQQEVINAWKSGDHSDLAAITGSLEAARTEFGRTAVATDQAKGAIAEFGSSTKTTAEAADDLKAALDSLMGVELQADEAAIQWQKGLKDLRAQIASTTGAIRGNSTAALDNRQAIIDQSKNLLDRIDAEARAGASATRLAGILKKGRQAIVDNAVAAGANRRQVEKLIATYNMTPKQIRTLIEAAGVDAERVKMERLINQYKLTPKKVRSIIEAAGAETAADKVRALRDYINQLHDKSVTITTTHTVIRNTRGGSTSTAGGHSAEVGNQADGGIQNYASGGLRNLPAGIYNGRRIMFAEPGTGGEAFIPLAAHKRTRSEALLAQVAAIFGGAFIKFADGGFTDLLEGVAGTRFAASDNVAVGAIKVAASLPGSGSAGSIRLVDGRLRLEGSGAYIRGIAVEAQDDGNDFDSVIGRMN